jgi:hypothetical protein
VNVVSACGSPVCSHRWSYWAPLAETSLDTIEPALDTIEPALAQAILAALFSRMVPVSAP